MYAIVQVGSQQFKVAEGDVISVQRLEQDQATFQIDQVLLYEHDGVIKIGKPYLSDVKVSAQKIADAKDQKAVSFKYWKRKSNSWKKGHRQTLTVLRISKIEAKA